MKASHSRFIQSVFLGIIYATIITFVVVLVVCLVATAAEAASVDIDTATVNAADGHDPQTEPQYFYLFNRTTRHYTDVLQFQCSKEPHWVKMRADDLAVATYTFVPKDWMVLSLNGTPYLTSAVNVSVDSSKKAKFDLGSWTFVDNGETLVVWREVKTKDESLTESWTFSFILGTAPKVTWEVKDLDRKADENRTLEWHLVFNSTVHSLKDKARENVTDSKLKEKDLIVDWSDFGRTNVTWEASNTSNEWVITFNANGMKGNFTVDPAVSFAATTPVTTPAFVLLGFTNSNSPYPTEVIDSEWLEFYWIDTAAPNNLREIDANPFPVPPLANCYVRFYDIWGRWWQTTSFAAPAAGDYIYINGSIPLCWISLDYTSQGRQHDMFHRWGIRPVGASTWLFIDEPVKFPCVVDDGSTVNYEVYVPEDAIIEEVSMWTVTHAQLSGRREYTIPVEVTLKSEPISVVVRYYDATTGEGIPWETYVARLDGTVLGSDVFRTWTDQSHTLVVEDYFGNTLFTETVTGGDWDFPVHLWACDITAYSVKFFNSKPEFVHKIGLQYDKAGSPYEFYIAPLEVVELHLKPADYRISWTPYRWYVAQDTQQFDLTVSEANYFLINGTLIANITTTQKGVYALTEIITTLLAPNLVIEYDQLPHCPAGEDLGVTYIHPYSITTADVSYNITGSSMLLWTPHPDRPGRNYTVDSDVLYFSGAYGTEVYINWTGNGTTRFHMTTLPATLDLGDGGNYSLWASSSIDVTRKTTWREYNKFWWTYYTGQSRYEVTLAVNNTQNLTWRSVNWFVGWPEGRTVDVHGVTVYDVNNGITLAKGDHYDVTMGGVYFYWNRLNSSTIRSFKVTAWDYNTTGMVDAPVIVMTSYARGDVEGRPYYATGSWGNDRTAPYRGPVTIALKLDVEVDPRSIIVWNVNTNSKVPDDYWVATSTTVTLTGDALGEIPAGTTVNLKVHFRKATGEGEVFLFDPVFLGLSPWVYLVILSIGLTAVAYKHGNAGRFRDRGTTWTMGAVCLWALVGITYILHSMEVLA